MKIAVDVDGVLADLITPLLEFHNEKHGTNFSEEDVVHHEMNKVWGGTVEETDEKFREFFDSPFFEKVSPYPGVLEAVEELGGEHELIILTSRIKSIKEDNKNWIEDNFPCAFGDILHSDGRSKPEVCSDESVDILIDDYAANFRECSDYDIMGIMVTRPWNENKKVPKNVERVNDWNGVLKLLQ